MDIVLADEIVDITRLEQLEGVVFVEIVKGQYRVKLLEEVPNEGPGIHCSDGICRS